MSQLLREAFEDEAVGHGETPTPRQGEHAPKSSRRDKDADLFYLRSAQDAGKAAVVFDELMGFEDEDTVPAGGRSVRSKKNGTRKSKKRGTAQAATARAAENTFELQSLLRISYGVICLKKKKKTY